MVSSYQKHPLLSLLNHLSLHLMSDYKSTPKFVISLKGWMRENFLETVEILSVKDGKHHLIEGEKETIFLAKKLHNKEISPIENFQIILIEDTNLCLCNKATKKVVGVIKANG